MTELPPAVLVESDADVHECFGIRFVGLLGASFAGWTRARATGTVSGVTRDFFHATCCTYLDDNEMDFRWAFCEFRH